jgi:hypothetical protein
MTRGLLGFGERVATTWADERCAVVGTGRTEPDEHERRDLASLVERLPVTC